MANVKRVALDVEVKGKFEIPAGLELLQPEDMADALETGLALIKLRIQAGERADGAKIFGESGYSTEPIYIPLTGVGTGNPLAKPRGGRLTRGVKGEAPRTMHFPGGYREFREKNGRGSNPVNLTLSGNVTGKRFRVIKSDRTGAVAGWGAGSEQALAAAGLDAREGGQIFSFSPSELDAVYEVLEAAIVDNLEIAGVPRTQAEKAKIKIKRRKASK